jgi:prefoldin alpha subunit
MAEQPTGRKISKEEMAYLERAYQNQYMVVGNAINSALGELRELSSASEALENMERLAGKESFSGIGGDFYIRSQIKKDTKVIIGVGGGFLVEKDIDSAKQTARKRVDAKNEMINRLVKGRKELEDALAGIQEGVVPGSGSE